MIRVNLLSDETDLAHRAFYRWWTVSVSRDHVKLGPVTVTWYRWLYGRMRVGLCHGSRERIVLGGPLS